MPSRRAHNYVNRLIFGKPFPEVNRAIDSAYLFAGRGHRRFFHKPEEAFIMGNLATLDYRGGQVGLFHAWLDKMCSKDKEFKKWLEFMAKQDILRRNQMRRMVERARERVG